MKIHDPKRKNLSLFQSKLHSIAISGVIDYILEAHSTRSSLKKKKASREKEERKTRWKKEKKRKEVEKRRGRKKGWKEFVCKKRKKGE